MLIYFFLFFPYRSCILYLSFHQPVYHQSVTDVTLFSKISAEFFIVLFLLYFTMTLALLQQKMTNNSISHNKPMISILQQLLNTKKIQHTYLYNNHKMNCRNVIIAGFNSGLNVLNQYLTPISQIFQSLNKDHTHQLLIVSAQQFTTSVLAHPRNIGICIGGSSVSQCYKLNQVQGIRAAVVHNKYIAQMCRKHNDANVVIISTDCIADKLAGSLVRDYLLSGFDQEERNMLRIQKMRDLDEKYGGKVKLFNNQKIQ